MKIIAKPIDMVVWFTRNGSPNPVRFRFERDDEAFETIRIDKIICRTMEKLAGNNMIVYRCQSQINGAIRTYEIKYELSTCKWILFKM